MSRRSPAPPSDTLAAYKDARLEAVRLANRKMVQVIFWLVLVSIGLLVSVVLGLWSLVDAGLSR